MMKTTSNESMLGDAHYSQFQLLRVRVEQELRGASVIMVTSAHKGDGKTLTAYGLAHCLAQSGHRTALVDATHGVANALRHATKPPGNGGAEGPAVLSMPKAGAGRVREATARFVATARETYDYTILDCGVLLGDQIALSLAALVDGVIVSVCVGRAPVRDDKAMVTMIQHSDARLLGVVAVTPQAISEHKQTLVALPEQKREHATATLGSPSTAGTTA
jgi:Mrp family chromosome partitioning ATPase